jgi:hypothetical protein
MKAELELRARRFTWLLPLHFAPMRRLIRIATAGQKLKLRALPPWGALVSKVAVNNEWVDEDGFDPDDGDTYSYVLP